MFMTIKKSEKGRKNKRYDTPHYMYWIPLFLYMYGRKYEIVTRTQSRITSHHVTGNWRRPISSQSHKNDVLWFSQNLICFHARVTLQSHKCHFLGRFLPMYGDGNENCRLGGKFVSKLFQWSDFFSCFPNISPSKFVIWVVASFFFNHVIGSFVFPEFQSDSWKSRQRTLEYDAIEKRLSHSPSVKTLPKKIIITKIKKKHWRKLRGE